MTKSCQKYAKTIKNLARLKFAPRFHEIFKKPSSTKNSILIEKCRQHFELFVD